MNRVVQLVVLEDNEDDYLVLKGALESKFQENEFFLHWIRETPDPDDFLRTHDPDVILLNHQPGALNGLEFARQFRERNQIAGIILLSEMAEKDFDEIDNQSRGIGISDFLSKRELTPRILNRSVRYALENSRQRRLLQNQTRVMEEVLGVGKMALWTKNLDSEGGLFHSDSIIELTGYPKSAFQSGEFVWHDLILEEDRELANSAKEKASETERQARYRIRRKDGQIIWIEENFRVVDSANREHPRLMVGRVQDVTRRVDREATLRLMASALDQSSESIIVTDAQLDKPGPVIVYANEAASQMTGYSSSELIGNTPRIFQGPKTDRAILDELKSRCSRGEDFSAAAVNYRKDGSEYYVSWKIGPIRNEAGEVTHFISTQRDVTEEMFQQQELERHQAFLKEIGALAKVGGWRYDKRSNSVSWTEQVYEIHGVPSNEPVDLEAAFSFYTPDSRAAIEGAFSRCLKEGVPYDEVLRMRNHHGKDLWTRSKGEPLMENGQITGAWGVFQDITELHQIRFENEVFYDLAVELTCIASEDGFFLELNNKWEDVLGYSLKELKEFPIDEFVHPDDRGKTADAYKHAIEDRKLVNFENRYLHKDGHVVYFIWNSVIEPGGKTVYALARDITDLKIKELELEQVLLEANLANESKNQFLMVMSHEMRTPLNPILGYADLLAEQIKDPEQLDCLEQIKSSAGHLERLISDILDISSIEAGRSILQKEPFEIVASLKQTVDLLRSKAEAGGLQLLFEDNGFLAQNPSLVCVGDRRKIRQVILNLVSNAIKFTHEGSVCLEFLPPTIEDKKANICIRVTDTGIGIERDQWESIFDRFYQISMTRSREFGGQGLGLTLSRELARQMEGDISITSIPGNGSVFVFSLRLDVISGGGAPSIVNPGKDASLTAFSGLRILMVEDDPVNRMVMGKILTRLEVQFETANDGLEALGRVEEGQFDLILMDIQMPNMDGIEATRQIRQGEGVNRDVPIVAVSAHAIDEVKEAGFDAGMSDFLEKPISINKLRTVMEAMHDSRSF